MKKVLATATLVFATSNAFAFEKITDEVLNSVKNVCSFTGHLTGDYSKDWAQNAQGTKWEGIANGTANIVDNWCTHCGNAWDKMKKEED